MTGAKIGRRISKEFRVIPYLIEKKSPFCISRNYRFLQFFFFTELNQLNKC
jgi:hypothetical protein